MEGREEHWPFWSIALLMIGVLLLAYFFKDQKTKLLQHENPLMEVSLFIRKEFNIGLMAVLFHFMMHTAYLLMSAVYLQNGLGISSLTCGMYFVPHALLFMLSSIIASKLLVVYGKKVLLCGLLIIFISFLLQIAYFNNSSSSLLIILLIGIYGFGNGLVLPFLLNIVLDSIPVQFAGTSSGIFSTFQQMASALGISIIGGVFYNSLQSNTAMNYKIAFDHGLIAGMACLFVVTVMLYLLPKVNKENVKLDVVDAVV